MAIDAKTEAALRLMLDKQEIHEVMMRYCRAIDRMDEELLRSVYHPDAIDNHGLFNGAGGGLHSLVHEPTARGLSRDAACGLQRTD